jgi:hypothetical protein
MTPQASCLSSLKPYMKHKPTLSTIKMKTTSYNIATLVFAAVFGAAANPAPRGMSVDISEYDGVLEVREVVSNLNQDHSS